MTRDDVRGLFEDALGSEPVSAPLAEEDIARGRALRARRLRRRVGGTGAGALVAMALTLPASPLSLVDDDGLAGIWASDGSDEWSADDILPPRDYMAPAGQCENARFCFWQEPATAGAIDGGLEETMWQAVREALPDDVQLVEGTEVMGYSYRAPTISFSVIRDGDDQNHVKDPVLKLDVMLQGAGPYDEQYLYHPCSEPDPLLREWPFTECTEGADEEGRWRVLTGSPGKVAEGLGATFPKGLAVLDGEPASVTVVWEGAWRGDVVDDDAAEDLNTNEIEVDDLSVPQALPDEDIDAIAQAVWTVGANSDAEELHSGIDLHAVDYEVWPELQSTLEEELGIGKLTLIDGHGLSTNDPQNQTESEWFRYRSADGLVVDLLVWQKARPYETFCHDLVQVCDVAPGTSTLRADVDYGPGLAGPPRAIGFGTLGQRGGLYVAIYEERPGVLEKLPVERAGRIVETGPDPAMDALSEILNSHDAVLPENPHPNGS